MDPISGYFMTLLLGGQVVNHVAQWSLATSQDFTKFSTNTFGPAKGVTIGPWEWTATCRIYVHGGTQSQQNPFQLGLLYAIQLHIDSSSLNFYSGNAKCVDHGTIDANKESSDPMEMNTVLEGHGILVPNGAVPALVL